MTTRWFPRLYDVVMGAAERGRLGRWRRDVVHPAQGRVLEIASGTGLDFPHYRADATVVATEPDLRMLQRARSRAERAPATIVLVAADARALPFCDGAFDTVVAGLALCTIPSPPHALGELRRVLRPGGVARFLEHVRIDQPIVGWLQDVLTPVWRRVAGGCRLNERTVEAVRGAGFRIDEVRAYLGGCVVGITASTPQDMREAKQAAPLVQDAFSPRSGARYTIQGVRTSVRPYPLRPQVNHAERHEESR